MARREVQELRERPCAGSNFIVDLGRGDPYALAAGFSEVIFPDFDLEPGAPADGAPIEPRLILKRGVTGALDLYAWWNKARRGNAPQRRSVTVRLLAEDQRTVVMTWRFRQARPVSLSYSPLRAMDGSIAIETIELAFDSVEIS